MLSYYVFVMVFLVVNTNTNSMKERYRSYAELNKWAKSLGMKYQNVHYNFSTIDTFIADSKISQGDVIFEFPSKMFINMENAMELLPKKLKKVWKKYNKTTTVNSDLIQINNELAFLSLVQQNAYLTKKGKFYEFYQCYLDDKKDNLENFPSMFTEDEFDLVQASYFGAKGAQLKTQFTQECNRFDTLFNTPCTEDIYFMFRVDETALRVNENKANIIPMLDKIKFHPKDFNAFELFDDSTKTLYIKAKKDILPGEEIVIKSFFESNTDNYLHLGVLFEKLKNDITIKIAAMTDDLAGMIDYNGTFDVVEYDIKNEKNLDVMYNYYLNNITVVTVGQKDSFEAYKILWMNLKQFYDGYGETMPEEYYQKVLNTVNRNNIKMMMDAEKDLVEKRLSYAEDKMNKAKKIKDQLEEAKKKEEAKKGEGKKEEPKKEEAKQEAKSEKKEEESLKNDL